MDIFMYLLIAVIGYGLGNISTGLLIGRHWARIDIRQHGSGNAGTTNMLRTLGWLPSILTLLGDALKAVAAALIGRAIAGEVGAQLGSVMAIVGHNWPVALGFKGGRGIAASYGAMLVLDWQLAIVLLVVQVALIALTRYMSVASIICLVLFPIMTLIFRYGQWGLFVFSFILSAMAVYCHRENIKRLLNGTENRLDFQKINKISRKNNA